MKRIRALVFLLFGLGLISAFGASSSSSATMDAFVTTGLAGILVNNNYGGGGSLTFATPGVDAGEAQSVLQFNLGGAVSAFNAQFGAGQWSIDSVRLQFTAAPANNAIFNSPAAGGFGISWMQNDSWQEGTGTPASPGTTGITFSSLQSTFIGANDENLGTFSFDGATSGAHAYTLGLTPGFLNDVQSGNNVSLRLFANDSSVAAVFNSRNFSIVGSRPLLTVVAVPEPGTIALATLGVILASIWKLHARR